MPSGKKKQVAGCCATPARLGERPLITPAQADALVALFKVLANDTRLRMLHALVRAGELKVTDLGDALGLSPQAVSNQLQRLVDRGILRSRREGNCIYYRIINPCVTDLLDLGICLVEQSCAE